MIVEKLRNSIIQYALKGLLISNIEHKKSAKELIEECYEVKKRNGNKKKKNILPLLDDDKWIDIPEHWEWERLENICTKIVDGDHNPPKGEKNVTEYIMASSQNINNNSLVNLEDVRYLRKEIFEKENERTNVEIGDIFFTSVGTLGRSCIYTGGYNICFQRSVSVITTLINNKFLKYVLDSYEIQNKIINEATGTAQKGFYLNQLQNLMIPVPPLEEQLLIVEKLDEILARIDDIVPIENDLFLLKQDIPDKIMKSLLKKYFGSGADLRDFEKCVNNISSKQYQIKQRQIKQFGLYPVVSQSLNMIEGYFDDENKLLKHEKPYLVYGDHSNNIKYVDFDFIVGADGTKVFECKEEFFPKYIYYNIMYNTISIPKEGYSRHYKYLKQKKIVYVSYEEQKRIVNQIEEVFKKCDDLKQL